MRQFLLATLAVPLLALPVLAQTATGTMGSTTTGPTAAPTAPTLGSTTAPVTAPTTPNSSMSSSSPSITGAHPGTTTRDMTSDKQASAGGLVGANSFTEGQARSRLEKDGYSNVSGLAKDKDGVWRGRASKGSHEQAVGVDYKGNIVAN